MEQRAALITLALTLAKHEGVTHYAISMRALGKGDFFKNLIGGADCRTSTAARLFNFFSDSWPADLDWPDEINRPSVDRRKRKAA